MTHQTRLPTLRARLANQPDNLPEPSVGRRRGELCSMSVAGLSRYGSCGRSLACFGTHKALMSYVSTLWQFQVTVSYSYYSSPFFYYYYLLFTYNDAI